MSLRKIPFVPGEYYHIYNRGNSKQKIFNSHKDFQRFVSLLYGTNTNQKFNFFDTNKSGGVFNDKVNDPLVSIGAYCLMSNHFHILITPLSDKGLSKFMQKLSTAYSMYFNEKYARTGGLFEGKFKSEHLNTDKHLKYIFSYLHLNPIKIIDKDWKEKGIKDIKKSFKYLMNYPYSSFLDYVGKLRSESLILKREDFPNYFPSKNSMTKEIIEWLNYREARPNDK